MSRDEEIRKKLVAKGVGPMSDAELLSIIIRDGGKGVSAISVAESLLESCGNTLTELGSYELSRLRMIDGLGLSRAAVVAAAMELGKRRKMEEAVMVEKMSGKEDVVAYFKPLISELRHEEFWAVYLNSANRVLDKVKISQGGISQTVVDNKLIVKRALDKLASAMIVVHNHPSGNPDPTAEDINVTHKLRLSLELFDIELLDHVIITSGECLSLRGEGIL